MRHNVSGIHGRLRLPPAPPICVQLVRDKHKYEAGSKVTFLRLLRSKRRLLFRLKQAVYRAAGMRQGNTHESYLP